MELGVYMLVHPITVVLNVFGTAKTQSLMILPLCVFKVTNVKQ